MALALFAHMLCLWMVLRLVAGYTGAKSGFQPLVCVQLQQKSVKGGSFRKANLLSAGFNSLHKVWSTTRKA